MKNFIVDSANLNIPVISSCGRSDGRVFDYDGVTKMLRDNKVGSGAELNIVVNATHSGTIVNRRVYPGVRMADGVESWVYPYGKPVLADHPGMGGLFGGGGSDPKTLGRVNKAEYVKLVQDSDRWENDWKHPSVGDTGSGFIRLYATITDKDAIEAVLGKRLLTVSTGQYTDRMLCSICGSNHMSDSCEHTPGSRISLGEDGKKKHGEYLAYAITGKLRYDHVAFVNTPGSPFAAVVSMDDKNEILDYREDTDANLMDFSVEGIMLNDEHGPVTFNFGEEEEDEDLEDKRSGPRVSALISNIGDYVTTPKRKKRKKRPGVDEGTVTVAAVADKKEQKEQKMKITADRLAESIVLRSLKDGGLEFDWEGYKERTGNDRSLADLVDADLDLSEFPDSIKEALSNGIEDKAYAGPDKTFPVFDEHTGKAAKRLLPFVELEDKAGVDAGIEARLSEDESEEQNTVDDNQELVNDKIADLEVQVDNLKDKLSRKDEEVKILRKKLKDNLVQKIMDARTELGKADIMGLDKEQLQKYENKLRSRSMESLEDTLVDLLAEMEHSGPSRTSTEQVSDNTVPASETETGSVEKDEEETVKDAEDDDDPLMGSFLG